MEFNKYNIKDQLKGYLWMKKEIIKIQKKETILF